MIRILPRYGISFIKIDRITTEGPDGKPEVISASRVRKLLAEHGVTDEVLSLVPECTAKYLKESFLLKVHTKAGIRFKSAAQTGFCLQTY